jgi:hypothetical protein
LFLSQPLKKKMLVFSGNDFVLIFVRPLLFSWISPGLSGCDHAHSDCVTIMKGPEGADVQLRRLLIEWHLT